MTEGPGAHWLDRLRRNIRVGRSGMGLQIDELVGFNTFVKVSWNQTGKVSRQIREAVDKGGRGTRATMEVDPRQADGLGRLEEVHRALQGRDTRIERVHGAAGAAWLEVEGECPRWRGELVAKLVPQLQREAHLRAPPSGRPSSAMLPPRQWAAIRGEWPSRTEVASGGGATIRGPAGSGWPAHGRGRTPAPRRWPQIAQARGRSARPRAWRRSRADAARRSHRAHTSSDTVRLQPSASSPVALCVRQRPSADTLGHHPVALWASDGGNPRV